MVRSPCEIVLSKSLKAARGEHHTVRDLRFRDEAVRPGWPNTPLDGAHVREGLRV